MSIRPFTSRIPFPTTLFRNPVPITSRVLFQSQSRLISSQDKIYDVPYDSNEATQGAQSSHSARPSQPPIPETEANETETVKEAMEEFKKSGRSDVGSGSGSGVPGETGNPIYDAADKVGSMHNKSSENPSVFSSGGAIGRQFNPDGNIGQIGEKIGGPFSKEGVIGRQFDASGGGIAGTVEKLVDGPSQKKPGDAEYQGPLKKQDT